MRLQFALPLPDLFVLLIAFTLPLLCSSARPPKNAILLSEVQSLTLRGPPAKTTSRRVSAIPQLKCVSPAKLCALHAVDVMRCENAGSSYGNEDVEWSCTASLPEELKLGSTEVICEGYASSSDPYVLKGSCGVEYRLVLTDKGERRYPDLAGGGSFFRNEAGETDYAAWAFGLIFVAVLGWIVYSACFGGQDAGRPAGNRGRGANYWGGGGGGGGGWGPGNDPPPPYPGPKPDPSESQSGGWRPGFWSGAAMGGAAGYAAGSRAGRREDNWGGRNSYGSWGAGPSSRASSFGSSSGVRHESTGFGSTSRR